MTSRYGNVTDADDDDHRIMRDGERLVVSMHLMDSIQHGERKMTTLSYTLADGTEQSVTTSDAAAVQAIEALTRVNDGLRGQLVAQDATIAELKAKLPVADGLIAARDAARQQAFDCLRAQNVAKHDEKTAHGAYVTGVRDAWKTGQAWR